MLVLIDCGASHNFISSRLVKSLGLKVEGEKIYKVRLGDGNRKSTQGNCKGVRIQMGEHEWKVINRRSRHHFRSGLVSNSREHSG